MNVQLVAAIHSRELPSPDHRLILMMMATHADTRGHVAIARAYLAWAVDRSERQVQIVLSKLLADGVLTVERSRARGRAVTYAIDLSAAPVRTYAGNDGNPIPLMAPDDGNPIPLMAPDDGNPIPLRGHNGNPIPLNGHHDGNPIPPMDDPMNGRGGTHPTHGARGRKPAPVSTDTDAGRTGDDVIVIPYDAPTLDERRRLLFSLGFRKGAWVNDLAALPMDAESLRAWITAMAADGVGHPLIYDRLMGATPRAGEHYKPTQGASHHEETSYFLGDEPY